MLKAAMFFASASSAADLARGRGGRVRVRAHDLVRGRVRVGFELTIW
jgi:hypothetical protein